VENEIGRFLHIDLDVLRSRDKRVSCMLVEVDIHLGLLSELDISWRGEIIVNRLITGIFRLDVNDVVKRDILVNNVMYWISMV